MAENFIARHWGDMGLEPFTTLTVHIWNECIVVPELGEVILPRNIEYDIDEVNIVANYGDDAIVIDHRVNGGR